MKILLRRHLPGILACLSLVFVGALLAHEHFNGGVRSHHLLDRQDLPALSNGYGLIVLPVLGWLLGVRLRKHMTSDGKSRSFIGIGVGAVAALVYGATLAASFALGAPALASGLFFALLLLAVVLPIYRVEYIFGFVVGMTFTFGAVLPVLVAGVVAAVSALVHLALRALMSAMRPHPRP